MDPRIDHLSENELGTILDGLEAQANELKAGAQFVGTANVKTIVSDSGAPSDYSGVLPADPQNTSTGYREFSVQATASTIPNLYADLIVYVFKGSLATRYTPSDYLVDVAASAAATLLRVENAPFDVTNPNKKSWLMSITGDKTTTYYLKFYVVANAATTIAVTAL